MLVAIPLFERFTALDAVGPYEVLQRVPTIDVTFVGHRLGEVRSDNGMLGLMVENSLGATYDPQPPFDSGSLATASDEVKALALEHYKHRV